MENKKSMFVLLGLVLALGFTYICFEWTNTEVTVHDDGAIQEFFNDGEEEIIPQTEQDQPKPEVTPRTVQRFDRKRRPLPCMKLVPESENLRTAPNPCNEKRMTTNPNRPSCNAPPDKLHIPEQRWNS